MIEEICKYIFMLTACITVVMLLISLILFLVTDLIPNSLGIKINNQVKKTATRVEYLFTKWGCNVGYLFIIEFIVFGFIFIILR